MLKSSVALSFGGSSAVGNDPLPVVDRPGSKTTSGTAAVVEAKLPATVASIR